MEYKKFGNTLIVRLDRGEEVVDRLLELARREVANVHISDELAQYMVRLTAATRTHPLVHQGGSPRATLALTAIWSFPYEHRRPGGPGLRRAPEPGRHQRHLRAGGHPSGGPGGAEDGPGNRPQPHGV